MHMRTTIILKDDLVKAARKATGIKRKTDLVHAGLEVLIQREAARALAGLYGKGKNFVAAPRSRAGQRALRRAA